MILALLIAAAPCVPPGPDAQVKVAFPAGSTVADVDRFVADVLCQPKKAPDARALSLVIDGTVYGRQLPALVRLLVESAGAAPAAFVSPEPTVGCPQIPAGTIVPVDPWKRTVAAAARDALIACAQGQLRLVPHFVDGKAQGYKLFAIRPEGVPAQLGLQNGDIVTAVNGATLHSTGEAVEAYAAAKTAPEVKLAVTRKGEARTITWVLR